MKNDKKNDIENVLIAFDSITNTIESNKNDHNDFQLSQYSINKESLRVVQSCFSLTDKEAVFFTLLFYFQMSAKGRQTLKGIAEFLKVPLIKIYRAYDIVDSLYRKGIITIKENHNEDWYQIKRSLFKQVLRMETPKLNEGQNNVFELAQLVYNHVEHNRFGLEKTEVLFHLKKELDDNQGLPELKKLQAIGLNFQEQVIFLLIAFSTIVEERNSGVSQIGEILYPKINQLIRFKRSLVSGTSILIRKKILNFEPDVFRGGDSYILGPVGIKIMDMGARD